MDYRTESFRSKSNVNRRRDAARVSAKVVSRAVAGGKLYIDPVLQQTSAFAPATIANLGPGFDWMGCAVEVPFLRPFNAMQDLKYTLR